MDWKDLASDPGEADEFPTELLLDQRRRLESTPEVCRPVDRPPACYHHGRREKLVALFSGAFSADINWTGG